MTKLVPALLMPDNEAGPPFVTTFPGRLAAGRVPVALVRTLAGVEEGKLINNEPSPINLPAVTFDVNVILLFVFTTVPDEFMVNACVAAFDVDTNTPTVNNTVVKNDFIYDFINFNEYVL